MRVWYFVMAIPFCAIGILCTFGAVVTGFFERGDPQRPRTLKTLVIAGVACWAVAIFLVSL